jgi:hypothetical protein
LFRDQAGENADHDRADDRNFIHDATPCGGGATWIIQISSGRSA